jgi:cyclic pyranopterin phosphate synthase
MADVIGQKRSLNYRITDFQYERGGPMSFNHFDNAGQAIMVDVSHKEPTLRTATAAATVRLTPTLVTDIVSRETAKGDVLAVARLAGIAAAKKTPELIPLSHPLAIHHVSIDFRIDREAGFIEAAATVKAFERTGVEMEAMTAASVAALTIYDMCKGANKGITIDNIRLLYKEGGKSGVYRRDEP